MNHPNAVAAFIAAQTVWVVQYLTEKYTGRSLSDSWKAEIIVVVPTVVLYIGREGVKAALVRVWRGAKAVWNGPSPDPLPPTDP